MKPNQINNPRQDPFFPDGLIQQQPYYGTGFQAPQSYPGVSGFNGFGPAAAPSTALAAAPAASTGLAGLPFNMTQIKGFVDRMGGIDGLMGHVGRIQKFIQSMQQMGPMIKVLMGSFGKAKTAAKLDGDGLTSAGRRRRRAPRRRTIKGGKKTYKRRSR